MTFIENSILQHENVKVNNYRTKRTYSKAYDEIIEGLFAEKKYISSKFFYNKKGSELFEEITKLDEYYPTRTEMSILKNVAPALFGSLKDVDIIELGSGDCSKISLLLDAIPINNISTITYVPVDVSKSAAYKSANILSNKYSNLNIDIVVANFLDQYDYLERENKKIVCFLGSTIGNLDKKQASEFVKGIAKKMNKGDQFLLGADMVKELQIVEEAYNDKKGVTAAFNRNILNTVNEITGANFNTEHFNHVAFYNQSSNRIEMHLEANVDMEINIPNQSTVLEIQKGATIHTENSHKFTQAAILDFAQNNDLKLLEIYTDSNAYFSLSLFEK